MSLSGPVQHIALVVPGLFAAAREAGFPADLGQRFPALERLLSRSKQAAGAAGSLDASLRSHFDLQCAADAALPVAALTCLVDIGEPDAGYIIRADPVHLRADRSSLRLFDSRSFEITQDEADALVAAFNEFYSDSGLRLTAPGPQRWYLYLRETPLITTVSPQAIAGQSVDPNLPRGRDAAAWHTLMNEVQMLFHRHPVNLQREQRGEPLINSLWFWGEGRLPDTVHHFDMQVFTDDPLAMGMAHFTRTPRRDLPADLEELLATAEQASALVVLDDLEAAVQYQDFENWLAALDRLEQCWFAPLLAALDHGRIASLEIDPCGGKKFRTTRRLQKQFWKRVRPLASLCQHA